MKKNALIVHVFSPEGIVIAKKLKEKGYYVYGLDPKEDYEGTCDRSLRFDIKMFASDAEYRIRFTQILDEITPRLDALVICQPSFVESGPEIRLDRWLDALDREVTGPMLIYKLFEARLVKSKGKGVFLAAVRKNSERDQTTSRYVTSGAIEGLVYSLGKEKDPASFNLNMIRFDAAIFSSEENSAAKGDRLAALATFLVDDSQSILSGHVFDF